MPADFNAILSQLAGKKKPRPDSKGNYLVLCPFHDDHSPSLSIHPEKGGKCFSAGCEASEGVPLAKLADKLGLSSVSSPAGGKMDIETTYDYQDADGSLLFQVVRLRNPKRFSQRRLDSKGKWIWNLRDVKRVLYNLPKLLAAPPDDWIFVVEGEKDVHVLEREGFTSTTNPGGSGKWRPEYGEALRGRRVVILPDNDTAGDEHARQVSIMLNETTTKLRIIRLPDLPQKGDVSDWFNDGGTAEKLNELVMAQPSEVSVQGPEDLPSPQVPDKVWVGLFANYRDLVANTTEAPDAYHFVSFAVAFGAALARRVYVYHARKLYPNFYTCLVGRTGVSRKDTAWSRGRDIVERLYTEVDPTNPVFQIIPGIGSAEALVDALGGERKIVILSESEFLSLLSKAKQETVSNLIPKLTALFDCPPDESIKTRQKTVIAKEPFLSVISGTTMAWLQLALSEKDIYGGFANRFMFVYGEPKAPLAFPPKMDKEKLDALVSHVNDVREWADSFRKLNSEGEIRVPPDTQRLFAEFYNDYYRRCAQDSLGATLIVRVQGFIWKLALLYAAMEFSDEVLPEHLEVALAAGEFLERSILYIFNEFNIDKTRAKEAEILSYLKRSTDGPVSQRDLYRALHLSATDIDRIIQSMVRFGVIVTTEIHNPRGRSTVYYELP